MGERRRPIPVVCDLTDAPDTAEARLAEYERLFDAHLLEASMHDGVVRFRFRADDGVERWVRDLAAREQRCCAFFEFSVRIDGAVVIWDATVGDDDAARAMLEEWALLPETVGDGAQVVRDRWAACGLDVIETAPSDRA